MNNKKNDSGWWLALFKLLTIHSKDVGRKVKNNYLLIIN